MPPRPNPTMANRWWSQSLTSTTFPSIKPHHTTLDWTHFAPFRTPARRQIHQAYLQHWRRAPELLEKAKSQVNLLKKQNKKLAKVVGGCLGQYYRYHGDWKSETQSVVSMLKFMHWLETRSLLEHKEAKEKLGCMF
eukprot:XP_025981787.1 uncharacterized protein LOC112999751 [Glycine max]